MCNLSFWFKNWVNAKGKKKKKMAQETCGEGEVFFYFFVFRIWNCLLKYIQPTVMLLFKNLFFFFLRVYLTPSLEDRQNPVRLFPFLKGCRLVQLPFCYNSWKNFKKQFAFLLTDVTLSVWSQAGTVSPHTKKLCVCVCVDLARNGLTTGHTIHPLFFLMMCIKIHRKQRQFLLL